MPRSFALAPWVALLSTALCAPLQAGYMISTSNNSSSSSTNESSFFYFELETRSASIPTGNSSFSFLKYTIHLEPGALPAGDNIAKISPLDITVTISDTVLGDVGTIDMVGDSLGNANGSSTGISLQTRFGDSDVSGAGVFSQTPELTQVSNTPFKVYQFTRTLGTMKYLITLDDNTNDYFSQTRNDGDQAFVNISVEALDLTAAPEPTSLAILGSALAVGSAYRLWRRRGTRPSSAITM